MTALFLRLLLIALAVLVVIALLRALVRRLWPLGREQPSSRRARLLSRLDEGIAKARIVALACAGVIIFVVVAKTVVHRLVVDGPEPRKTEPAQAR